MGGVDQGHFDPLCALSAAGDWRMAYWNGLLECMGSLPTFSQV